MNISFSALKFRLLILFKYFIFWLVYFLFVKSLFILFNWKFSNHISIIDFTGIYYHGLKMDISSSSYVLLIPFIVLFPSIFFESAFFRNFIRGYTYIFIFIVSFLVVVDLELYKYWGFRLDNTPLMYLNTPREMLASVEWYIIVKQLIILVVLVILSIYFYTIFLTSAFTKLKKGNWIDLVAFLPLFAFLVIPLRGGVGLAPLNTGNAYFSKNEFANHCAINVLWNVGYSITESERLKNPYILFSDKEATKESLSFFRKYDKASAELLNTERPNILIIIIESFTAKLIHPLGGKDSITPCFNRLVHEGILFKDFYGSGVRSDKGIVAILSGFPAQPMNSIMKFPDKTQSLPFLTRDLQNHGYHSAYYYGGNIDFVSMRSYITNAGFNKIVSMTDFPSSDYNAKWGVHDHIMFKKLKSDMDTAQMPFIYVYFTLSSHEPFDVPMKTVIPGSDMDHKFMNSIYYTDSCLGDFIDRAKKTNWWKNTLVIITADHGTSLVNNTLYFKPVRFLIPMLWIGGAVHAKDTSILTIGSQTDIPLTVLAQLNIKPKKDYTYSRDILDSANKGFAYYAFNNGFGIITDSGKIAYDYNQKHVKLSEGTDSLNLLHKGQAYLQLLYNDFMNRK